MIGHDKQNTKLAHRDIRQQKSNVKNYMKYIKTYDQNPNMPSDN